MREWMSEFKDEMRDELERKPHYRETLNFMGKMLLAGILFRIVLFFNPDTQLFQAWLAEVSRVALDLFGYGFERQGFLLVGSGPDYLITRDCLGWKSMAAFVALVFASAEKMRREAEILVIGVVGLALANVVRVVSTIILSEAGVISFDVVHTFLWRWGMTILVLVIWYLWLDNGSKLEIQGIFK